MAELINQQMKKKNSSAKPLNEKHSLAKTTSVIKFKMEMDPIKKLQSIKHTRLVFAKLIISRQ